MSMRCRTPNCSTSPRIANRARWWPLGSRRRARLRRERWAATPWRCNGEVPGSALRSLPWALSRSVLAPAETYLQRGQLSARGFDRVLRLAWSVADLAGHTSPVAGDVAEALFFRTGRSEGWAA